MTALQSERLFPICGADGWVCYQCQHGDPCVSDMQAIRPDRHRFQVTDTITKEGYDHFRAHDPEPRSGFYTRRQGTTDAAP